MNSDPVIIECNFIALNFREVGIVSRCFDNQLRLMRLAFSFVSEFHRAPVSESSSSEGMAEMSKIGSSLGRRTGTRNIQSEIDEDT